MNNTMLHRAKPHAIALGIFFIISCIYCFPAFQGLIVSQHDATGWKGMAQQSMEFYEKHGRYPLWTNSIFSGMPAFQIVIGSTYNITIASLHYLFTLFLPEPAGLFFLACLGFYILCMTLKIKTRVAILGSLAYAFASYNAVIVSVGHTTKFSSMGYTPAVLAGLILLTQRRYLLGFIVTLIFSTQLFYQNHVQIAYYMLLMASCLGITYTIHAIRNKEIIHLLKAGSLAIVAGIMGMLSYAVILFPTYDYAKETMRGGRSELTTPGEADNKSTGGLDKAYAFMYSYGITEVLTIAVPRMYGGSSSEMQPGSRTAEALIEKTGMSEEQADENARYFPTYWGSQGGPQGGTSGAVYFGSIICILFISGLVFYKGWHIQWITAATILGILLAWGSNFAAFNYFLFDHLPFYNKFRAPSMALVIPQLTIPLLASLGLNQLFENNADRTAFLKKFKLSLVISGAFLTTLLLLYFAFDYKSEYDAGIRTQWSSIMLQQLAQNAQPSPEMHARADEFGSSVTNALKEDRRAMYGGDLLRSLIFIALATGVLFAYARNAINSNITTIMLTVLIFIDLIGVDLRYLNSKNYVEKDAFAEAFIPNKADLQVMQDTTYYRVFNSDGDPYQLSGSTSRTSYLHNSVGGYHPAKLALYDDLIRRQLTKGNMQVFNMLNTKYFIVTNPTDKQQVAQLNPDALGPAWFVKAVKYVNNANEEMQALDNFHPHDTAIVDKKEQPKIPVNPRADSSASIRLVKNENDYILYNSSSGVNGFAVFSEIYYPNGWKAFIDGKEAPIVKVNYLLRGLSVLPGNHRIEFKFEPASYTIGNTVSMIIGVLSILALVYSLYVLWKNYRKDIIV